MASLAETYALACGVKLSEPEINQAFYPLSHSYDKVVLIHAFAGAVNNNQVAFPSKIYDYFNEVVALIKPVLDKHGFALYQIGGPGEPTLKGVNYLCGKTNFHQTAFLLKNCALLIGNDSMNAHIAGAFKTPVVVLYGPTDPKNHGPYWKSENALIESHRFGAKRPSYQAFEPQKTINLIAPELVANHTFQILGLSERQNITTLFISEVYPQNILEVVPDVVVSPEFIKEAVLNIRMDYLHDEQKMAQNVAGHKSTIITNAPINIELLKQLKPNLVSIRVRLTDKIDSIFIRAIKKLGIPYQFFTEDVQEPELSALRFKLYDDILFDNIKNNDKENFLKSSERYLGKKRDINFSKLYYRSNKFILTSRGIFASKAAYDANLPILSFEENEQQVLDTPEFWKEHQHFWIYEKE